MSGDAMEILNPDRQIKVAGELVTVKELNWRDGMQFLKLISKYAAGMFDAQGKFAFTMDKLAEMVSSTQELTDFLLTRSTGKDLEWLSGLRISDALEVLALAVELNLNEELLARGKKVAGRVGAAFGVGAAKATLGQ